LGGVDPLMAARKRGEIAKRRILAAEGGALRRSDFANLVYLNPNTIDHLRRSNRIFWLKPFGKYLYPMFQVSEHLFLPGITETLASFDVCDPWMRVNFMLTGDARLEGARPIDRLRNGDVEDVLRAARGFGKHGGY
jgi:hypothetical protein